MLTIHKEAVEKYNATAPRWRQIRFSFFCAVIVATLALLVSPVPLALIGAPSEIKDVALGMAVSLSGVGFLIVMLMCCVNGFYYKRDLLMKRCEFTHEPAANYLAWAYRRGAVIMYMGSVVLMTVMIAIALLFDSGHIWVASYFALAMITLCAGIFAPLEWRYHRYAWIVRRNVGGIEHAWKRLPETMQTHAKHYALFYGHSGVQKAVGLAFVGNYHADRLNAERAAQALGANTPKVAVAPPAPARRL